jgi:hypothetical protein
MVIGGAGSLQSGVVQPKTTLFIVNNNEKQWLEPPAASDTAAGCTRAPGGGAGSVRNRAWHFSRMHEAWKIRIAPVQS